MPTSATGMCTRPASSARRLRPTRSFRRPTLTSWSTTSRPSSPTTNHRRKQSNADIYRSDGRGRPQYTLLERERERRVDAGLVRDLRARHAGDATKGGGLRAGDGRAHVPDARRMEARSCRIGRAEVRVRGVRADPGAREAMIHPPTTIDALRMRRVMGKDTYAAPVPFGPNGWHMRRLDQAGQIIATAAPMDDGLIWLHASLAYVNRLPEYSDLVLLHRAVFGDGYAYQVFAPAAKHVDLHPYALHLWGRADGKPALPEF